ncbi:MAG: tetratricopeptide repeat protein [Phreatobacter sp.]|uniref:tetratricopeptide repeat protein n=1 Tax=Phreatobacter sp. TaxID=1966341 RepID=UPI001A3726EA|nr:tetratricopeptide repeat protein [Phreatobacter sp.]MBL8570296.1 tetratricopeptide repeat protein [Phreatobacter sp.]
MIISMPSFGTATDAPAATLALRRREALGLDHAGRHEDAVEAWRAVLHASPDDADAAHALGSALAALGRHAEALASFERALQYAPSAEASKMALARSLLALGRHADARVNFEDILAARPEDADALSGQSACLRLAGKPDMALAVAERAAGLAPDHPRVLLERARALADLKRGDEATAALEDLCHRHKDQLEAAQLLARYLVEATRPAPAIDLLKTVVAARPDDAGAWQELACALSANKQLGEALDAFRRALVLKPTFAAAHANMAMALADLGRLDEAVLSIDRSLSIEPDSRSVRFTKGCIHLTRGEFGPGWAGYEHRFTKESQKGAREDVNAAPWLGESLAGRSILVLGEQANGDYIQFASHLPRLTALGAKVSFFTPQRLKRLFMGLAGDVEIIPSLTPGMRFDHQCHLMSLPDRFHRIGEPIPTTPWLSAEPGLVEKWLARIGSEGFRVGIAWRGSNNDSRSFGADEFAPLAAIPGVRLISLHTEAAVGDLPPLVNGHRIETLGEDFDSGEDGFVDAAAAIECLDLVISCDTSIAHLAGALGRPVWTALKTAPEWRWQRGTSTSVWYPSMRLFRQSSPAYWHDVFGAMEGELRRLAIPA